MEASDGVLSATADPDARRAAFTAIYDQHVAEVYRFVHRRCNDRATAEDVTQDTFLTAVRTIEDPADVSVGWLIQVARHRLIDILARQSRYAGKLRLLGRATDQKDVSASVAERMRMRDALAQLDVEQRLVLMMHYVDGLTIAALADELGRSPKAVEALVTRARRNLRRELQASDV